MEQASNLPLWLSGESAPDYARYLRETYPRLTRNNISALAGVNVDSLRRMGAFITPPADGEAVRNTTPRLPGESNPDYARRLHKTHPRLTRNDISALAGVSVNNLQRMGEFRTLGAEGEAVRNTTPRLPGESNPDYARRLHKTHPRLTRNDISALSDVSVVSLQQMGAFITLSAEGEAVRNTTPRLPGESNPDYARRLHEKHPRLTLNDISALAGVNVNNLRNMGVFITLSADDEAAFGARKRQRTT